MLKRCELELSKYGLDPSQCSLSIQELLKYANAHGMKQALEHWTISRRGSDAPTNGEDFTPDALQVLRDLQFGVLWAKSGYPVFRPTVDLLLGLSLIDCQDIPCDEIRLPFDSFIIELPESVGTFSSDGGQRPAALILANNCTWEVLEKGLVSYINITCLASEGRSYSSCACVNAHQTIGEAIQENIDVSPLRDPITTTTMQRAWNLLSNLCLYIAMHGLGTKQRRYTKGQKSLGSKQGGRPVIEVWRVGKEIKLSPQMRAAALALFSTRTKNAGWQLAKRFTVRGHWRQQAHGPSRSLRRRVWIKPHWKGPESAERLTHLYMTE